jgi:hypothetical protein
MGEKALSVRPISVESENQCEAVMESGVPSDQTLGSRDANAIAYDACTKSGAWIMLLTAGLGLLIPYWRNRPAELAAGRYTALRENLTILSNTVQADPLWQKYVADDAGAESASIADLLKVRISGPKHESLDSVPAEIPIPKPRSTQHAVPNPPTELTATIYSGLNGIHELADALVAANDSGILTESRKFSNFYNFSIVEWTNRRNALIYRNEILGKCVYPQPSGSAAPLDPNYGVPPVDRDGMLQCLTVSNVKELAEFDRPVFSNPAETAGRIQKEVDLNPSSFPRDLATATVLAEVLLFFMLTYFGAFVRQVCQSGSFPAPGSLFKAFSDSRWSLLVLFVSIWLPCLASVCVAYFARSWSTVICGGLISFAAYSVFSELSRVGYLKPLTLAFARSEGDSAAKDDFTEI